MSIFKIYKGKKVFITGHTGFKGSWLSLWLTELGADVCGYALEPNTDPALFDILGLQSKMKHIIADIRDFERLKKEIALFSPDLVFHMAAQPLVRVSYKEPLETYQTNVLGTANILEACRLKGDIKAIVNITTDKCYKNKELDYAYKESDEMGGYDPYSNSKACSELITSSYRDSFFNNDCFGEKHNTLLASARAGNVIGGGDYSQDRLIPDFIKSIHEDKDILIRKPNAIRPWQFVLEPLSGYLLLGKKLLEADPHYAAAYNFGPYDEAIIPVEEVIKKSISILGKGSYSVDDKDHPHEANLLKLNIEKAKRELGWHPVYSVDEAIESTMKWYKAYHQEKQNMLEFTKNQIIQYSNKIGF